MPIQVEISENSGLVRVEGEATISSAGELKNELLKALATGRQLQLDLEKVEEVDVTLLQLVVAAGCAASDLGAEMSIRPSKAALVAARDAGFHSFPGTRVQV